MQNGKTSDFVNARAMFKGKTKDQTKDKYTLYLGQQDIQMLLDKVAATQGNPDGAKVSIFIGKNKSGKDSASILVENAQPRQQGGTPQGNGGFQRKPVAFRPKAPVRQ